MRSFCPRCGAPWQQGNICARCHLQWWENPVPAACAVAYRDGCYLMLRRCTEPYINQWDFPGGFVDPEERIEDALRRELLEEVGLQVGSMTYLGSWPDEYTDLRNVFETRNVLNVYFLVALQGTDRLVPSIEGDPAWIAIDELSASLAFPRSNRPAISTHRQLLEMD